MAEKHRSPGAPPEPDPDQTQRLPVTRIPVDEFLNPWPTRDRDQTDQQ